MFILLLAHICSGQVLISQNQNSIGDTLIVNLQLSGVDTLDVTSGCVIKIFQLNTDPVTLIGLNGGIVLVTDPYINTPNSQKLYFESPIGNCSSQTTIKALLNNILNYHLQTTYNLQILILRTDTIVHTSQIIQIQGLPLKNNNIKYLPGSNLNQAQTNLTISLSPLCQVSPQTVLSFVFPFRDYNASSPQSLFFKNGQISCKSNFNLYSQCQFNNNNLTVKNLTQQIIQTQEIILIFQNFTNPQDINGVQGISFQIFNQYQGNYYVNEINDSGSITGLIQNTNLKAYIYNSCQTIESINQLFFVIQVQDFYYQDTNIIINLPLLENTNQLLQITPQNQLAQTFITSVSTNQIILKDCLIGYVNNGYITFMMNLNNPYLARPYEGVNIQLQNNLNQQIITQTNNQSLIIEPQNIIVENISTTNPLNGGTTNITITLQLNSSVESDCTLEVLLLSNSSYTSNTLIQSLKEINCQSSNIIDNKKLLAFNCFQSVSSVTNIQRQFTLTSVINPRFQKNNIQGDIQINTICRGYINNINQQPLYIPLAYSHIKISSVYNQKNLTNSFQNTLQINYKQENYLFENDTIEVSFDDQDFEMSQISYTVGCLINGVITQCANTVNGIKLQVNQILSPGVVNIITLSNFITQVSVKNCINIQITTLNGVYVIDQSLSQCLENVVQANNLNLFNLSIDDLTLGASTIYKLLFQFSRTLNDGTIFIFFSGHHNLSQSNLQQNPYFQLLNCFDSALQINIQKQLFMNTTYQLDIQNIGNPKDSIYLQPIQIKVFSADHYLRYQDNLNAQIQFKGLFYKNVKLSLQNQLFNQLNNISILINPNIPINSSYQLQILISNKFIIQPNFQVYINNQNLSLVYITKTTEKIILESIIVQQYNNDQSVNINLVNIINPDSNSETYFINILTFNNEGTQIIEQGQQKFDNFYCLDGCLNCSSSNICSTCQEGYNFYRGNCLKSCPQQTTLISNQCLECQLDNCLTCNTYMNKCIQCTNGYSNIDGYCQDGQTAEIIHKYVDQNKDYWNLLLVYFYIIQLILFMIHKWRKRNFQFFKTQIFIKGLMDNICLIISFSFYISDQMYGISILMLGFILARLIQQVNSQLFLLQFIKNDIGILKLQRLLALQFILRLSQFYDWKICYLLESHLSDKKYFHIQYENQVKIQTIQIDLQTNEINIINSGLLVLQIISISVWIDSLSIFQISFGIYLALSQLLEIISLTYQKKQLEEEQLYITNHENDINI